MKPAGIAQLARLYLDIALFRRGPQDVPASGALLLLTLAAYFIVNLLLSVLLPPSLLQAAGQLVIGIAFIFAWYRGVLALAGHPERLLQTATALFGYQAVLAPLFVAGTKLYLSYGMQPPGQIPASVVILALLVWTLAINGRVLRAATGWPMFVCVGVVLLQVIVLQMLVLALFGQSPQER
jgi:hypothetical protein